MSTRFTSAAGGGFGDPLERNPENLVKDVINEYVSVDEARRLYGVIINKETLQVDQAGTENERRTIRKQRLSMARAPKLTPVETDNGGTELMNWSGVISLCQDAAGDRYWQCNKCDHVLGDASVDWKNYAAQYHAPMRHGQPLGVCLDYRRVSPARMLLPELRRIIGGVESRYK